ncbi:MAG: hypothetical protein ACYCPO_03300 [Acidobacteriaceae bacterium]
MAKKDNLRSRERVENSWYELVAGQLQALIPKVGIEDASTKLYQAYELICRTSLGCPVEPGTRSSRLNLDGTPIQFALALGHPTVPLQFLSEAGNPDMSHSEALEFIDETVRALSALLQLHGDLDSILNLIHRAAAADARDLDPDRGGKFWVGAGFASGGKSGVKIYVNGKCGAPSERWAKLEDFAEFLGATKTHQQLRKLLDGKMTPLGMAVSLQQDENPNGRIYLSGYGNSVSYYENLLRHLAGRQSVEPFRAYTRVMLGKDRAYPTQSAVFSVGFEQGVDAPPDVKVEFCGHCLFQGDVQARERCLEWLTLRNINPYAYTDQLEVLAGQMSSTKVNTHVYLGLGWKKQREYTTIYLKPHPAAAVTSNA